MTELVFFDISLKEIKKAFFILSGIGIKVIGEIASKITRYFSLSF